MTVEDLQTGRYTEQFVPAHAPSGGAGAAVLPGGAGELPSVDARSLVPAEIMGRIYFALLEEIEARRFQVFGERITVPTARKVAIAFRCWAAARFGSAGSPGGRAA